MPTIMLDRRAITALEIGPRLTKLRIAGSLVVFRNAGAMTVLPGEDVGEGLHPAESDLQSERYGAPEQDERTATVRAAMLKLGCSVAHSKHAASAAAHALGPQASIEDLLAHAMRLPQTSYTVDTDSAFAVVGVNVAPAAILAATDADYRLAFRLASGRQLLYNSRTAEILHRGKLARLTDWPQPCCRECVVNNIRFVNCRECGGWRNANECPHPQEA
jgi:hypothetical protein